MGNILSWRKFNENNVNDDYRDSWKVVINEWINGEKHKIVKILKLGDSVEQITGRDKDTRYIHPIYDSQATPVDGIYTLTKVPLKEIDVVFKGIANRDFFKFDDDDGWQTDHLNSMKEDFFKTPPVTLEKYNGKYYSVDGHHRATVAKELGFDNILAFVTEVDKLSYEH